MVGHRLRQADVAYMRPVITTHASAIQPGVVLTYNGDLVALEPCRSVVLLRYHRTAVLGQPLQGRVRGIGVPLPVGIRGRWIAQSRMGTPKFGHLFFRDQ